MQRICLALLFVVAWFAHAHAANVPSPLNAPASSTGGHMLCVTASNGQQTSDCGVVGASAVTGPGSSTSGDVATFSGTTGKVIQDSAISITGTGSLCTNTATCSPSGKTIDGGSNTLTNIPLSAFTNLGTATTVLHGNVAGNPTFSAVAIATDVSGLGTGVATWLATPTSANLFGALSDETGSGSGTPLAVFNQNPTLNGATITAGLVANSDACCDIGSLSAHFGTIFGAFSRFGSDTTNRTMLSYLGTTVTPTNQYSASATGTGAAYFLWNATSANDPKLTLMRSKSGTVGTFTAVASGDPMGEIDVGGADGTAFATADAIVFKVDNTVATGSVPGRIEFYTTALSGSNPTLAATIDSKQDLSVVGSYRSSTVTALTTSGTVSLDPTKGNVFTCTPSADITALNAASVPAGQTIWIVFTTTGTTSRTITFNTSFKTTGTLATGTVSGKVFTMSFVSDGTNFNEVARSTAM